jgi:myosin heavy subunit
LNLIYNLGVFHVRSSIVSSSSSCKVASLEQKNFELTRESKEQIQQLQQQLQQSHDREMTLNSAKLEYVKSLEQHVKTTAELKEEKQRLTKIIKAQEDLISQLRARIAEQDTKIAEQDTKIAEQDTKIAEQNTKIAEQDTKITETKTELAETKTELAETKTELAETKTELTRISHMIFRLSVREAVRTFENLVAIEVVGSKTAAKKQRLYNFSLLQAAGKSLPPGVTQDIVDLVALLKDQGDDVAHEHSPKETTTPEKLRKAMEADDDDDDDKQNKDFIVAYLEKYYESQKLAFGTPVKL